MKNTFNFLQVTNWLIICRENIIKIREEVLKEQITKQEAITKLQIEKRRIQILRKILERKADIHGISPNFLKKLKDIKKEYGIEE